MSLEYRTQTWTDGGGEYNLLSVCKSTVSIRNHHRSLNTELAKEEADNCVCNKIANKQKKKPHGTHNHPPVVGYGMSREFKPIYKIKLAPVEVIVAFILLKKCVLLLI